MQISCLRADYVNGPPLPSIFAKHRKIEFQSFQSLHHIALRQTIDIETKNHQRVNKWPVGINLAILEYIDLVVRE